MPQAWKDFLCAILGHDKDYIAFGKTRIPYRCKRCGRLWNNW